MEKTQNKSDVVTRASALRFFNRFFIQIVIIAFLIFAFGFFELGRLAVYRSHPNLYTQDRASAVLENISGLIQLPKGTPTMAVINNATSAKKIQPFLAHANDGDILIVYKSAGEAILYRPSTNKLVSVGPIYKSQSARKTSSGAHAGTASSQSTTLSSTQHAATTSTSK